MTTVSSYPPSVFEAEDEAIEQELGVKAFNERSPYNHYGYKPVEKQLQHVPLKISGQLPADLEGVYLRNGTNTQFAESHVRAHCFNGAGMLHQVQFLNGQATYSNMYIRTPVYEIERASGREVFTVFSDIATAGPLALKKIGRLEKRMREGKVPALSYLETVQSSTAVQFHKGRIFCLAEVGYPFALDAKKDAQGHLLLDGSGRFETWGGKLSTAFSAHPRIDPGTGDFFSVTVDRVTGRIDVTHVSNDDVVNAHGVHQQTDETGRVANLHDCFLTDNFVVFPDASLRQSREWLSGPEGSMFRFDPTRKLRFGVLPRNFTADTPVRWFETDRAGFIWHTINGWERKGPGGRNELVLHAPMFHEYPAQMPIHTPQEPPSKLNKWVLDLDSGKVIEDRTLLEHGYERPSFNLAYSGKANRYAYLLDEERGGYMGKGVLKYDLLDEKEVAYFDYQDAFGGEALFVPRANSQAEDDGYLVELLMEEKTAALVVIDARSMKEVARVALPQRVPFGVHACWLDQQKLAAIR